MEEITGIYIIMGLAFSGLWVWIFIEILRFSTREIRRNSEIQVKLLIELLKKQGVDKGTIDEILKPPAKYDAGV